MFANENYALNVAVVHMRLFSRLATAG